MSRLGIVTGMKSEADCLAPWIAGTNPSPALIACAGGNPGRAHSVALRLIDRGANMLVSMGIAGGLAPALRAGDVVVADTVIGPDGATHRTDDRISEHFALRLQDAEMAVRRGPIATVEQAAATSEAKRALRDRTGALAADMESSGCAAAAATRSVRFTAIRVVADPYDRSLPPSATRGLAPDGTPRPLSVIASVISKPWELAALYRAGRDSAIATNVLRRVAALDLRLFLSI